MKEAFAPKLSIPKWVPESVAQFVREKYAADVRRVYAKAILNAATWLPL